jgi:hypothetical protein
MSAPQWAVVDIGLKQMEDMRNLFQHVFGHPLSERLWRWKYDDGRGVAVGARAPDGALLAHYGGTFRTILFFGHPALTVQVGDVMVAREGRALLSHKGPFGMVMQGFLKQHIGVGRGPVLGFGFPNARAMRLGVLLDQYVRVDTVHELSWPVEKPVNHWRQRLFGAFVSPVDWSDSSTAATLDTLWARMSRDLAGCIVPVRDSKWWSHRYANHPDYHYECFWVRSRWPVRRTLGAVVLRAHQSATTSGSVGVWELMDWLCPVADTQAMLQAAKDVVLARGGASLMGWFSSAARAQFSGAAAQEVCAVSVTAPSNGRDYALGREGSSSVTSLGNKWWLTSGDTDFR